MKIAFPIAAAAAVALVLAGCTTSNEPGTSDGGDGELQPFAMVQGAATIAPNEAIAMYAVAKGLGFYEEEGLDVEILPSDGSTAAMQAIASGSAQVASGDAANIIAAYQQGVPVQGIAAFAINYPWKIAVSPSSDIRVAEDLAGKKIGIISLASGSNAYTRAFLQEAGIDPDTGAELIPVGVGAQALAAIEGGDVDALALFGQAYALVENLGFEFRYLENPAVFDPLYSASFAATTSTVADDPEALEGFLRASYKALVFSAVNPRAAMQIGYQVFPELLSDVSDTDTKLEEDTRVLAAWIESATLPGAVESWHDFGMIDESRWDALNAFATGAGTIQGPAPFDEAWTQALLPAANDFDVAAIVAMAKEYDAG